MLINCDLGECLTPNPDEAIMPLIDMANIACGGHVGDDNSMVQAIQLAVQNGVKIGAHPSYADVKNFGRVSQPLSDEDLFDLVYQQVKHFQMLCNDNGAKLSYIKPHGALYHDMMNNQSIFEVLQQVISTLDSQLLLVVQSSKNYTNEPNVLREVFADRGYFANSTEMIPRGQQGAVLNDANAIIEQYHYFTNIHADTVCFHSDNPASVEALRLLRQWLKSR